MSSETTWLLLLFAIMVVAVLAILHGKLDRLEQRLRRVEARAGDDADHIPLTGSAPAGLPEAGGRRDRT